MLAFEASEYQARVAGAITSMALQGPGRSLSANPFSMYPARCDAGAASDPDAGRPGPMHGWAALIWALPDCVYLYN